MKNAAKQRKLSKIITPDTDMLGWKLSQNIHGAKMVDDTGWPVSSSQDLWSFRPWMEFSVCSERNGCISGRNNGPLNLWPKFLWQHRANFLVTRFCFDVHVARAATTNLANQFIDNVLTACPPLPARSNRYEDIAPLVPVMEVNNRLMDTFGQLSSLKLATGPWEVINAVDYVTNLNTGFIAYAPRRLRGADPFLIVKELYTALDEISPLGLPMGFEWDNLNLDALAMMYEATVLQFTAALEDSRASLK